MPTTFIEVWTGAWINLCLRLSRSWNIFSTLIIWIFCQFNERGSWVMCEGVNYKHIINTFKLDNVSVRANSRPTVCLIFQSSLWHSPWAIITLPPIISIQNNHTWNNNKSLNLFTRSFEGPSPKEVAFYDHFSTWAVDAKLKLKIIFIYCPLACNK